jgi:GNAT superfamily N-acetyltransferase
MHALRIATAADAPAIQSLIQRAGRDLSVGYYTPQQAEALTRLVFGVDTQLIADGTYFVIEDGADIVAAGGWSRRRTLFGGDQTKTAADPLLDPAVDAARIRAFFVEPSHARRGLGRQLMDACLVAARADGFKRLELVSTLPGEPLYLACGFRVEERFDLSLTGEIRVPVSRMARRI